MKRKLICALTCSMAVTLFSSFSPIAYAATSENSEIINHDFESGNLDGWTVENIGNAPQTFSVSDAQTYWGGPFLQNGKYHVWGYPSGVENADTAKGIMKSSPFIISGAGYIDFLVSGGNDINNLYVALVRKSDGRILEKCTGNNSEAYSRQSWDASQYIGTECYIQVYDNSAGGFGHINIDDVNTLSKISSDIADWGFNEGKGNTTKEKISGTNTSIAYKFNDARFKADADPVWTEGVVGNALDFDGYSSSITYTSNVKASSKLTLEAWIAPRAYEWGDGNKGGPFNSPEERILSPIIDHKDGDSGYVLGVHRHGTWALQIRLEDGWHNVWVEDDNDILPTSQWSYIVATYDSSNGKITLYRNGKVVASQDVAKGTKIVDSNSSIMIGKNRNGAPVNPTVQANMFNGVLDEVKIAANVKTAEKIQSTFDTDVANMSSHTLDVNLVPDRSILADDIYRPQYHMSPPISWMNEPHAPIYFNGQYHIFYQYNEHGPYWHNMQWGHAVSEDMVNWRDLPAALAPQPGNVTPDGIWSGSSVIGPDGLPNLLFTAGNDKLMSTEGTNQRVGLATSTYPQNGDNDLVKWNINDKIVINSGDGGTMKSEFRDPFVWKYGNLYYCIVGSGISGVGGAAPLYVSSDLHNWTYKCNMFTGNINKYPAEGNVFELPVFLPLGNSGKWIFMENPASVADQYKEKYTWYWIGTWDNVTGKFTPDSEEPQIFDLGQHFTGPSGFVDPQGRSVVFNIAQENQDYDMFKSSGYSHCAGLPISLTLRNDGRLGVEPIAELSSLREGNPLVSISDKSLQEANAALSNVNGDMLEVELEIENKTAKEYGINVRATKDGQQKTKISINSNNSTFNIDRTKSSNLPINASNLRSKAGGIQGGNIDLRGENLKLHVFLDRSMVEAYANGLKSITSRVYPDRTDATGLQLFADGDIVVKSMKVWEMKSAYTEEQNVMKKPIDYVDPGVESVSPPRNLAGSVTQDSKVALTWNAPETGAGVREYKILRNGTEIATTQDTSYTDTSIEKGVAYIYSVKSVSDTGDVSSPSNEITITVSNGNDIEKPSIPGKPVSSGVTTNSISLTWTASTDNVGVKAYKILRNNVEVGDTITASFTDTGLTPNTDYTYTIAAYDAAGNTSDSSPALIVKTMPDPTPDPNPTPKVGELVNHDFEDGDLTGWIIESGNAFSNQDVTEDNNCGWGGNFNQNGTHHLWSFKDGGDGQVGVLKSQNFKLGGDGKINFLACGGNNIDNLYVALVRASDGKILFKATGNDGEVYSKVEWDASQYIGTECYIKVVDNSTGGFGHINIDDVNVPVALEQTPDPIPDPDPTPEVGELVNHDFEKGDLTDWIIESGNAFSNQDVADDNNCGWGGNFNQSGKYHLWSFKDGGDGQVGALKSQNFKLGGDGKINLLTCGGNDINNLYVALVRASDGQILFKATGNNSEVYSKVEWDASQYIGTECYIKVVDNSTGGFGHINIDDVNVPVKYN